MYYSLNEFHLSSANLPGLQIYHRKYKLQRWTGISEKKSSPYTKIGLYKNEIYTYISISYQINIDKFVAFIAFVCIPWWWWVSYIITTYVM